MKFRKEVSHWPYRHFMDADDIREELQLPPAEQMTLEQAQTFISALSEAVDTYQDTLSESAEDL